MIKIRIHPAFWILAAALLTWAAPNDKQAELLLQAAMKLEMVDGNLDAAIQQYKHILASHADSRTAAAKALVQMGRCYEQLGRAEARSAYERVVREYADQREPVGQARIRLAALEEHRAPTSRAGIVSRQVWTGPQVDTLGSISPDGRSLSFVDWETGDLALRNLATGEHRRLTNKGSWDQSSEFALFSRFSPDGRQIAYTWMKKNFGWEIRVGPVDGASYRALYSTDANLDYTQVEDWSPDGKHIAILLLKDVNKIGLLSTAGGPPRVLKSFDWRSPGNMRFSPDGKYIVYDFPPNEDSPERDIYLLAADGSREVRLVEHSADDYLLAWLPGGRILFVSDRGGTTDAWTLDVSEGKAHGTPDLLRKNLGQVSSLGLTRGGSLSYGLRVGGHDVYTVSLDPKTREATGAPSHVARRFIGTNTDPDWSPDGRRIVYVSERGWPPGRLGARVLCATDVETGVQRELPIRLAYASHPRWSPDGRSILFRARDDKGRPSLFVAEADTGRTTLHRRRPGSRPSRWSPDGGTVFVVTTDYGDPANNTGRVSGLIVALDVKTGAEKELFRETTTTPVGDALLNDLAVSPDGRWLAFTVLRNKTKLVLVVPSEGGEPHEIFRSSSDFHIPNFAGLSWTPDGKEILLVKGNSADQRELWALPSLGGKPRPLGLSMKQLRHPTLHPDGLQVAFQAGRMALEVWTLENLQRPLR